VAIPCEHGYELSGSIKCAVFFLLGEEIFASQNGLCTT